MMQIVNIAGCRSLPVRFTDGGFPSCVNEHNVSLEKLKQLTVLIKGRAEIWPVFDAGFSFCVILRTVQIAPGAFQQWSV